MRTVGLRELKNRLSTYVGDVRRGERIGVTDRGELVAELVPADRSATSAEILGGLARSGELTRARSLPRQNRKKYYEPLPRALKGASVAELLRAEREESS